MKPFSRRSFLKITGVAASGVLGGTLGKKRGPLPEIGKGDSWPDMEERWGTSVCQLCPGGCGVRARVVDGRVVKLEGNPFHPVNRGRLCPLGQAAPQLLYHPDRLRVPMARDPQGKLRPVSWDGAIGIVAQKLKALRDQKEAHTAVFLAGSIRGLRERFLRRFMTAFGSPNYVRASDISPEDPDPAYTLTQGFNRPLAPDLFAARSILSFGAPLLEGGPSPVYQMRAYGQFRQGADRPRGLLIQVESRRSNTADRADKWVAIRPGTETTFALGVAHVLILEHLYDEDFVERYCDGFNDAAGQNGKASPGFRTIVLRDFTLPRVSEITGVPAQTIISISRAFARNQPGVAIAPFERSVGSARLGLRLAVHYLNALVGNLGKPGGMLPTRRPPLKDWEAPKSDAISKSSLARPRADGAGQGVHALAGDSSENLPERILSGKPYPVKALLVAGLDPLFDHPRSKDFEKAIERVPFIVSFSSMPDALTRRAHVVLPDAMFLERWSEDAMTYLAGFSALSLGQPVVRTKDSPQALEDTVLGVAKKMGGPVAESFKWKTFADAIREAVSPLAEAGLGYVASDPIKERFRMILTRQGYWQNEFKTADEFWKALVENGAWWEGGVGRLGVDSTLHNPSRKFHFFPDRLDRFFSALNPQSRAKALPLFGLNATDGRLVPADPLVPARAKGEFGVVLFRPLPLISAVSAELPWMQEQLSPQVKGQWDSWVEVHPEDAKRLALHNGDTVELRSKTGSIRTKARIFSGVVPGTIAMPVGLGRVEGGRWAKGRGADPRRLLVAEKDPVRGMGVVDSPLVQVRKVS